MDIYSMSHQHLISDELKEKLKKVNDNFIEKYGTYLPKDDYAKETNINKYLFRGIRKDNGKWIEGGYCYCNNKSYIVIATQYIPDTRDWDTADYYEKNPVYEPTFIEVYTKTVGQYTTFNDINNKKVFEGDIISIPFEEDRSPWEENCIHYENAEVYFDTERYGWYVRFFDNDEISLWEYDTADVVVVGNIYDNTPNC